MKRQGAGAEAGKRGEVEAARLEMANLELERKQAIIRAPIDGVVTSGDVKVGDILEPGKPVAEIAEQEGFRFEAAVPSEEVGHLRVGMPARIKLDAYDYQRYGTLEGTVVFISPDSGVPEEGKSGVLHTVESRWRRRGGAGELAAGSSWGWRARRRSSPGGRASAPGEEIRQTISSGMNHEGIDESPGICRNNRESKGRAELHPSAPPFLPH